MGVERGVLHHNLFGHADTEGGEVPDSTQAALNHSVSNLLGYFDRHSQYPNLYLALRQTLFKLVRRVDGNAIHACTYQKGIDIKSRHNLQTKLRQA